MADIAKHHHRAEDLAVARPDRRGRILDGEMASVARDQFGMHGGADGLALVQAFDGHVFQRQARMLFYQRHGLPDIEAQRQLRGPACQLLGHPVQVARLALRVGGDHAVADRAERHFGQFLALGDHNLAQLVLGNVPDDAQRAVGLAAGVREDMGLGGQPVFAAIGPDHAVLQRIAAAPLHAVLQHLHHVVAVIGMHAGEKGGK